MKEIFNNFNKKLVDSGIINKLIGYTSGILHILVILVITFISIFSFNIKLLWITWLFSTLILIGNIILHDCPLSNIETSRLGDSYVDIINKYFPINYDNSRRYEVQLQYIFLTTAILGLKILFFYLKNDLKNILNIKYT